MLFVVFAIGKYKESALFFKKMYQRNGLILK